MAQHPSLPPLPQCTARLGAERVALADGESRMRWPVPTTGRFDNTGGIVHGGYLCVFADALLGSSLGSLLEPGQLMVTPDLSVQFLERVRGGQILDGTGRVVQKGGTIAFMEAEVRDAATGTPVLIAQGTGLVRERRPGNGAPGEAATPPTAPAAWTDAHARLVPAPAAWMCDMGAYFLAQGDGTAELAWPIAGAEFNNRGGTIQGGYLCLIVDSAMTFALMGGLTDVTGVATTTLSIHMLRPARQGMTLRARGEVVRRGHRFGFMRCTLVADDDPERPIATANATGLLRRGQGTSR